MTLYADVLFVINIVMNAFVLWVVSKATRTPRKKWRIFAGASVMAVLYTVLIFVPSLRFSNVVLASAVILAAGVAAAFSPCGWRGFFKAMAVAYAASFAVGGLGMALFFLTADWHGFVQTVSWRLALAGAVLSYAVIKFSLKMLEKITVRRQMLCNVRIAIGESVCAFDALVDTGHSLKEPLSQSPVIIAEFAEVEPLLPTCLTVLFQEKLESDLTVLLSIREEDFYNRIRVIPFSSLGKSKGMLIGFRPDSVTVEGAQSPPRDVVVGIYNDRLCRDGRYRGLLGPELVA